MLSRLAGLLALLLLTGSMEPMPVMAQAWQCQPPTNLPRPLLELAPRGEIRRASITGYVLALSWSPEFCRTRQRDPAEQIQCSGTTGDFGFIVHGLWPQGRGGNDPAWCRAEGVLSRQIIAAKICLAPSVQLLQHQWAKHGSCMARKPETYFGAAQLMFGAIDFPDMDRLSRQAEKGGRALNVKALAEEFARFNEGLPAEAIAVDLNRRGWLQEIRICLAKNFRPTRCGPDTRKARGTDTVKIWRGS
jgi:ribonuclease T2